MTKQKARVYAEDTKVPVTRTQDQIRDLLKKMGADRLAIYTEPTGDSVVFMINSCMYRITAPIPKNKPRAQAERAAWRALHLLVTAKSTAIKQGITTFEQEFLSSTVMSDGKTRADHRDIIISPDYRSGPPRLGFEP